MNCEWLCCIVDHGGVEDNVLKLKLPVFQVRYKDPLNEDSVSQIASLIKSRYKDQSGRFSLDGALYLHGVLNATLMFCVLVKKASQLSIPCQQEAI